MDDRPSEDRVAQLRARVRQLILMRETGPKSAAWHAARARLIWRLHDEIAREEQRERASAGAPDAGEDDRPEASGGEG